MQPPRGCDRRAGLSAAPVIARYGQAGLHLHLALLATVAGLACFGPAVQSGGAIRRTWLAACLACFTVGAFTSREPCLAAPGLVFVSACRRDMPGFRSGVSVGVVTTAVAVGVFALIGCYTRTSSTPCSCARCYALASPAIDQRRNCYRRTLCRTVLSEPGFPNSCRGAAGARCFGRLVGNCWAMLCRPVSPPDPGR